MDRQAALRLIRDTFERPFDKTQFTVFVKNLLNHLDTSDLFVYRGNLVPDAYETHVSTLERIGQYQDAEDKEVEVLIVRLKKEEALDRARTMQRNFIAWYLNGSRQGKWRDAALVAFVSPGEKDWRFSLVKMNYVMGAPTGKTKVKEELTPARRWSFLVGAGERSHTAQAQLLPLLQDDAHDPKLSRIEDAFNIETVTREFYENYRELFIAVKQAVDKLVAHDPRLRNEFSSKGVDTVNFAKKLLGQIVFLYFLQKKGWFGVPREGKWGEGSRQFLRELFEKKHGRYENFFNEILEHLFYDALRHDRSEVDHYYGRFDCRIPFLNGGLFDPMNNYDWVNSDILLPNSLFSNEQKTKEGDTGTGILDVFDRYNFTVREDEPFEKEVALDPELLGKAYEKFNAIRRDNFEDYHEALKSGKQGEEARFNKQYGVYYTPREVVHYMCQESLISYLDTALNAGEVPLVAEKPTNLRLMGAPATHQWALTTPGNTRRVAREDIEEFVRMGETAIEHDVYVEALGKETGRYSRHRLPESTRWNAALIDEKLADVRICDPAVGSGAFLVGAMTEVVKARETLSTYLPADVERTSYRFKRDAIRNSLYGVDIDSGAVEIAKLRLWLSLVVDEEDFKQIKPLPNLDYKVVQGNSLLGVLGTLESSQEFTKLEELEELHFKETNPTQKQDYKTQIDQLLKRFTHDNRTFPFKAYFPQVFRQNGGFDIIIANPPYVRQEQIKELKPELEKRYQCYTGTADIYVYFYERGLQLLRKGGTLTYISSNKYFRAGYGEKLRRLLSCNCQVRQIIDFADAPIFEAIAYPSIIVVKNAMPDESEVKVFTWAPGTPREDFAAVVRSGSQPLAQKELTSDGWRLESPAVLRLMEKLRKAGTPLGTYVNDRFYRGVLTGFNEAFVVDRATRDRLMAEHPSSAEVLKPFLRGKDVKRWRVEPQDLWLIFTRHGTDISKYPAIRKHLEKFRKELSPKPHDWDELKKGRWPGRKPGSYKWYEIQDNIAYWQEFEQPKIVYPDIAHSPEFAYDDDGYYLANTLYLLPTNQLWLLALLNSRMVFWFYTKTSTQIRGGFVRFIAQYVSQIPVKEPTEPAKIEAIVKRILSLKAANPNADVSATEREIDQLVYKLYGLTAEEIAVVETSVRQTAGLATNPERDEPEEES